MKNSKIHPLIDRYAEEAKQLVLKGFRERFGFVDHLLNPDLKDMMRTYVSDDSLFLIILIEEEIIATAALSREENKAGHIS